MVAGAAAAAPAPTAEAIKLAASTARRGRASLEQTERRSGGSRGGGRRGRKHAWCLSPLTLADFPAVGGAFVGPYGAYALKTKSHPFDPVQNLRR